MPLLSPLQTIERDEMQNKGLVFRLDYYVESRTDYLELHKEMIDWCVTNLEEGSWKASELRYACFYFSNEDTASLFKLRWF